MYDWHSLAYHGDEWLVAYASVPASVSSVVLFTVGHTVELYLKSAHTKIFGDIYEAIKFGHRIKDLWDTCKKQDGSFMTEYELRDSIFSVDFLDQDVLQGLTKDDELHFISHQSFYLVTKHLQDLKYLGLPWKTRQKKSLGVAFLHPDPFWVDFFKTIRAYLGYPEKGRGDHIAQLLKLGHLSEHAADHLKGLYQ